MKDSISIHISKKDLELMQKNRSAIMNATDILQKGYENMDEVEHAMVRNVLELLSMMSPLKDIPIPNIADFNKDFVAKHSKLNKPKFVVEEY